MLRLGVLLVAGLAACSDPLGSWQLVAGAETVLELDSNNFEELGEAATTFTLPVDDGDDTPGAFYRLDVGFTRGGQAASGLERVFVRVSPRFESFEGTSEVTTFLMPGDDDADPLSATLRVQGSLTRCDDAAACERDLGLFVGWLAPPEDGATLTLDVSMTIELRGSGDTEPPLDASAAASLSF